VVDTVSGCEASGSILLRQDAVIVDVEIDGPELFCEGDTVKLIADITNGAVGDLEFVWEPAEFIFGESNNDTVCVIVDQDQEFGVTITNGVGCEGSASTVVNIEEIDIEAIATTPTNSDTIKQYMVVQLDVLGADPNWTFVWTGDEVSDPNIKNPTAEPLEDAVYIVEVTDDNGCTDIDTVQITVIEVLCEPPFVFIPNAFSPNGDNVNDEWRVRGLPIEEGYIVVYNRWGEKMFETDDVLNDFWDGTYRGEECNPDSYGYYARIICIDGSEYEDKGNVTILR
jgi:gliding motility-associated-like protein